MPPKTNLRSVNHSSAIKETKIHLHHTQDKRPKAFLVSVVAEKNFLEFWFASRDTHAQCAKTL